MIVTVWFVVGLDMITELHIRVLRLKSELVYKYWRHFKYYRQHVREIFDNLPLDG